MKEPMRCWIRELPENITVIRDIVKSLDVPVKQVQIEARIVTVNEGDLEELGVRWGFMSTMVAILSEAVLKVICLSRIQAILVMVKVVTAEKAWFR